MTSIHTKKPAHASETTFAFQIPANSTLFSSTDSRKPYIFAFSTFPPEGQGASSRLSVHRQVGFITLDITKDFSPPSSDSPSLPPSNYPKPNPNPKPNKQGTITQGTNQHYSRMEKLIILHGFFASLGFLVILPAGSLVARYSRAFTMSWFKYHWKTNFLIAGPVITFGVALGPVIVQSKKSYRTHFANAHEVFFSSTNLWFLELTHRPFFPLSDLRYPSLDSLLCPSIARAIHPRTPK